MLVPRPCPLPHPPAGDSCEAAAQHLREQLDDLLSGGPSDRELARVKKAVRAGLLGAVQSNSDMAGALCQYDALAARGWRGLVDEIELVDGLGAEEVRGVAQAVFAPGNCFTGYALKA